jgi:hypothetical protein
MVLRGEAVPIRMVYHTHFLLAGFAIFLGLISLIFVQQPLDLKLYASIDAPLTQEAFRMYYESPYPLVSATYRLNRGTAQAFESGEEFTLEGIYEFSMITTNNLRKTTTMTLDESPPMIENFSASSTYHVGQTIRFVDRYTEIATVEFSLNDGTFTPLSTMALKLVNEGTYQVRLTDLLGNQATYLFQVYLNPLWSTDAIILGFSLGMVALIGITVVVYRLFAKQLIRRKP